MPTDDTIYVTARRVTVGRPHRATADRPQGAEGPAGALGVVGALGLASAACDVSAAGRTGSE